MNINRTHLDLPLQGMSLATQGEEKPFTKENLGVNTAQRMLRHVVWMGIIRRLRRALAHLKATPLIWFCHELQTMDSLLENLIFSKLLPKIGRTNAIDSSSL